MELRIHSCTPGDIWSYMDCIYPLGKEYNLKCEFERACIPLETYEKSSLDWDDTVSEILRCIPHTYYPNTIIAMLYSLVGRGLSQYFNYLKDSKS